MNFSETAAYTDFQGLATLRHQAQSRPAEAVEEVASQFESLFIQMMLKSMRDATVDGGLFGSNQLDTYQQMFDQQISLDLSRQGGVGLAKTMADQLQGVQQGQDADEVLIDSTEKSAPLIDMDELRFKGEPRHMGVLIKNLMDSREASGQVPLISTEPVANVSAAQRSEWAPATPEEFIRSIWGYAVSAAEQLGVDPAVLVAQSALETGWGKKVIKATNGDSSFNLFNIKANGNWQGDSATVNTLEYRNSVAVRETANFRVYDSLESAFNDYVDFLKGNPRYQEALEKTSDSREFLQELQSAGYATDPQYADKILNIMSRENYSSAVHALKNSQHLPLTG